jgi:hypothetical protein
MTRPIATLADVIAFMVDANGEDPAVAQMIVRDLVFVYGAARIIDHMERERQRASLEETLRDCPPAGHS